jgi:hypothetical protein
MAGFFKNLNKNLSKTTANPSGDMFSNLNSVKQEIKPGNTEQKFDELCNEAITTFKKIVTSDNIKKAELKKCADKFVEAIKIKSTRAEPYLYLSYSFYMLNKIELAAEYLNYAEVLDSKNNNNYLISELKKLIA